MAGWQQGLDSRLLQRLQQPLNRKNIGQVLVDRTDRFLTRFSLVEQQFERWGKFQESNPHAIPIVFAKPTFVDENQNRLTTDNRLKEAAIAPSISTLPVINQTSHGEVDGESMDNLPLGQRDDGSPNFAEFGTVAGTSEIMIQRFVEPGATLAAIDSSTTSALRDVEESKSRALDVSVHDGGMLRNTLTANLNAVAEQDLSLVSSNPWEPPTSINRIFETSPQLSREVTVVVNSAIAQAPILAAAVGGSPQNLVLQQWSSPPTAEESASFTTSLGQESHGNSSSLVSGHDVWPQFEQSGAFIGSSDPVIQRFVEPRVTATMVDLPLLSTSRDVLDSRANVTAASRLSAQSLATNNEAVVMGEILMTHRDPIQDNDFPLVTLNSFVGEPFVGEPFVSEPSTGKDTLNSATLSHQATKTIASPFSGNQSLFSSPNLSVNPSNRAVMETNMAGRSPQSLPKTEILTLTNSTQNFDVHETVVLGGDFTTNLDAVQGNDLPLVDLNSSVNKTFRKKASRKKKSRKKNSRQKNSQEKIALSSKHPSYLSAEAIAPLSALVNYVPLSSPHLSVNPSNAAMITTGIAGRSPQDLAQNPEQYLAQNSNSAPLNSKLPSQDFGSQTVVSVNQILSPIQSTELLLPKLSESLRQQNLLQHKRMGDRLQTESTGIQTITNNPRLTRTSENPTVVSVKQTLSSLDNANKNSELPLPKSAESLIQKSLLPHKQTGDRPQTRPTRGHTKINQINTTQAYTNYPQAKTTAKTPTIVSVNQTLSSLENAKKNSELLLPKFSESLIQKSLLQNEQTGDRLQTQPTKIQIKINQAKTTPPQSKTTLQNSTVIKDEKKIDLMRFTDVPLVFALPDVLEQVKFPPENVQVSPQETILPVVKTRLEQLLSRQKKTSQLPTVAPQNLVKRSPQTPATPVVKPLPQTEITKEITKTDIAKVAPARPTSVQPQPVVNAANANSTHANSNSLPLTQTKIIQTTGRSPNPPNPSNPLATVPQPPAPVPIIAPQIREATPPITETFQAAMTAATQQPPVDIQAIATQVEKKLRKKLVIERERRGQGRWR